MPSYNDFHGRSKTISTTAGTAIVTGPCVIHHISLSAGADAATLIIYDALTATGTEITLNAAITTTTSLDFGPTGIYFATGLTTATTGTTPTHHVAYQVGV